MLIAATFSSSGTVILNPVARTQPRAQTAAAASAATPPSSSPAAPSAASSSASGAAASSSGGHVRRGGGGGPESSASAASEVETLAGTYSTTIAGTQYAGSVEEENGSYVASVPNVSGATATGATMLEAENNLTIRIDELV